MKKANKVHLQSEVLPNAKTWFRIAEASWKDPLDTSYAAKAGGRWNPPGSFACLYLNEDRHTARCNLQMFIAGWPYEPEALRDDTGPILVQVGLPRDQKVLDAHSPRGLVAIGLPQSYPLDAQGHIVPHSPCQAIGQSVKQVGLRGVHARSAQDPNGTGMELAWFPAGKNSHARKKGVESFASWYWNGGKSTPTK